MCRYLCFGGVAAEGGRGGFGLFCTGRASLRRETQSNSPPLEGWPPKADGVVFIFAGLFRAGCASLRFFDSHPCEPSSFSLRAQRKGTKRKGTPGCGRAR
jgi:hypothetical protein